MILAPFVSNPFELIKLCQIEVGVVAKVTTNGTWVIGTNVFVSCGGLALELFCYCLGGGVGGGF